MRRPPRHNDCKISVSAACFAKLTEIQCRLTEQGRGRARRHGKRVATLAQVVDLVCKDLIGGAR